MFKEELTKLLNWYNKESKSGTPDFILAQYLSDCLKAFNKATNSRDEWYNTDCDCSDCADCRVD